MASLLPSTSTPIQKSLPFPLLPSPKPTNSIHFNPCKRNQSKCNAVFGEDPEVFIANSLRLDQSSPLFPVLRYGFSQFNKFSTELPAVERWETLAFIGLVWVYLTARPGVLMGAIDAYLLAPLQLGLDVLLGRRNLKMSDFVVGERLGEGSFGVVYSGAIVPKNVNVEERVGKRKTRLEFDDRFKERVILKKVILVGHSAGGLSVTHAMHEFAEKIAVAIFIAATMLPPGFQSEEDMKDGIPDLSAFGDVYELKFSLGIEKPPTSVALRKEFQRRILYQSTPEENSTLASMLLRPWPAAISGARFGKGKENLKDARRVFIRTTRDNMVKPAQQDAMIRTWPPSEVLIMDTDHSPFFSAPDQLFKLIIHASSSPSTQEHSGSTRLVVPISLSGAMW